MSQITQVIDFALSQVGYKENPVNITKYSAEIDKNYPDFYNGKKQGAAWCDIFVDYCFLHEFGEEKALYLLCQPRHSTGAGCKFSAQFYKDNKRFFSAPQIGDQIFFFDNAGVINHTGLVTKVTVDKVSTVEGNSGDMVKTHEYSISNKKIAGYGRPRYDTEVAPAPAPVQNPTYYVVVSGDTLTKIAKKYGTTVNALVTLNGISNPNLIYPGKKLRIPSSSVSVSVPAPEKPKTFIGIVCTNKDPLNIRNAPNGEKVGKLPKGTKIELFTEKVNGWYKLVDGRGYVSASYIK